MTRGQINRTTLEERLPAILQEQYRLDGIPRTNLPSWNYITANTRYSAEGLNNKSKELYGKTLHEFLREQGFGIRSQGNWPTDDEETIRSLEYYIQALEENKSRAESTIDTVESAINKVYDVIQEKDIDVDLLNLGRFETEEERTNKIQTAVTIIKHMDQKLSDGAMKNYINYLSDYYLIAQNKYPMNLNPIERARTEFDWVRKGSDPTPVTKQQIKDLWNALDSLDECPFRGYDLEEWRMWMKMLLVLLVAVGPRSDEIERLDLRSQLHFGDDPHVRFDERKNLQDYEEQVEVPIMVGVDFLRAYTDYIENNGGNGKVVPSPQSESGCRTQSTLNSWIKRLAEIADVRLSDGSLPTIQNFRQLWKTEYKKAVHKNRNQIKFVSEEDAKKSSKSDENDYLDPVVNRRHIRELGRTHFDDILPFARLPAMLEHELDQNEYIGGQAHLGDYASPA